MNAKSSGEQAPPPRRRSGYGIVSCLIVVFTLLVWLVVFTLFESALLGLSPSAERWLVFVTLILPSLAGIILGWVGVAKARQQKGWALAGLLLNTLVALFFSWLLLAAG